jgi:hypothetical protein
MKHDHPTKVYINSSDKGNFHSITCHEGTKWEQRHSASFYLNLAPDWDDWSTLRPGTHRTGGLLGPKACLNCTGKSRPTQMGFDPPTVQPTASRYTDYAIAAPLHTYYVVISRLLWIYGCNNMCISSICWWTFGLHNENILINQRN